ncbi:MAG: type II/IV secretion system protein [Gemmatimonadetes bacterium]|nr:type II/IV secretion system protein [Gemmatimonadota bacterium]MBP6670319.1 type II/IV secretion system protein [Gemmatimonadales bacterium]MBK6779344.1 type II/IV secretion system protein [Gemmatimonadota bacterium]MBK7348343.1 type II/IV secretion system protein [Gemmatimonadota bacterium]MBK7713914.1 type II/IV secretion system protein [Gemmatimonadota bacterium]
MIEHATRERTADAWLLQTLVDSGLVSPTQLVGVHPGSSVWQAVVDHGLVTDEALAAAVARQFRLKVADLAGADPRAARLVPESVARKHLVLPLSATERHIVLAAADPRDFNAEQAIRFVTGREVEFRVTAPAALLEKIDATYRPERSIERMLDRLEPAEVEAAVEEGLEPDRDPVLDAPVAKLVDAMICEAVRQGASDIHAEPEDHATVVRYRVDGVLREVMRLPGSAGASLVRRAKIFAKLDVTDPLHPHDGRAAIRVDGQHVDLRVSTVPIARRGEKVVIRILDKTNLKQTTDTLGLSQQELALLTALLGHREGMMLVTGPTGSGKTTTLYAALNQLKTGRVNIVTVEDPVEYDLAGISQIQVNEAQGLTFASALRSVLRQDPDIVLLGEIRDQETAKTAIQAGLSGHFVLSTLHTNDAPGAITRLRDMGIDSFKVASVLKGVLAQRLVRRVCAHCAVEVPLADLPADARPPEDWRAHPRVVRAVGCKQCGGTGYRGRLSVVEIMPIDSEVARLIHEEANPDQVAAAARRLGMRSLWESGLHRMWQGFTTLEELVRVLGERVQDDGSTLANRPSVMLVPEQVRAAIAAATPTPAPPVATGAPAPPAQTQVLVADDDPQMRRLVRAVLEREGMAVSEANDGLDAIDLVAQRRFDLIVLDMDMPRLDGLGVLEELGHGVQTSQIPVIVLTARSDETETRALDLGAQDYLIKPVRPTALTARVRAVLRRMQA